MGTKLTDRYNLIHLNGYSIVETKGFTSPTDGSIPKPKLHTRKTYANVSGAVDYLVGLGENKEEIEEGFMTAYKKYLIECSKPTLFKGGKK